MSSGDLKATDFGRVTDRVAGDKRSTYSVAINISSNQNSH